MERISIRLGDPAINDQGIGFDHDTGQSFAINPSARQVLRGLRCGVSQQGIAEDLARTFAIPVVEAERDVRDFLRDLRDRGLIESVPVMARPRSARAG